MGVKMVDVGRKPPVYREAVAEGFIRLRKSTLERIAEGRIEKGDIFSVASIAATIAVKKVPELIPLAHNIPITYAGTDFQLLDDGVKVTVTVRTTAKTGVEMEALTGVMAALLNIWDMVKKYEKDESGQYPYTAVEYVKVVKKLKGAPEE